MPVLLRLVIFIAYTFPAALFCFAQFETNPQSNAHQELLTVSGTVVDGNQRALSGVKVELRRSGSVDYFNFVMSDSAGNFMIPGVHAGTYDLAVSLDTAQEHKYVIVSRENTRFDIQLPVQKQEVNNSQGSVSVSQLKIPSGARKKFEKAQRAFFKNQLAEALERVNATLAEYPRFPEALTMRGILKCNSREIESGLNDLQAAIKIDPNYAMAYAAMGATYNTVGKYTDAMRTLNRAIALQPTLWNTYYELSKAELGIGNYVEAFKHAVHAIELNQEYSPIYLLKAHALMGMKKYQEAIANLELLLTQSPPKEIAASAREALEQARYALANAEGQSATPTAGVRPKTHE